MPTISVTIDYSLEVAYLLQGLSIDHWTSAVRSLITQNDDYEPEELDEINLSVIDGYGHSESSVLSDL